MKTIAKPLYRKFIAYFLVFLTLISSNSCNYFKVNSLPGEINQTTLFPDHANNRYIVHAGGGELEMTQFTFDPEDTQYMSATLIEPFATINYSSGRSTRFRADEKSIVNEVHFYLRNTEPLQPGDVKIPFTAVKEVRIVDLDSGKTAASYVFGTIGVIAGIFVIIMIIALLTKSSCPYVYVHNGDSYVFEGETFGGAIASNLERDDYMPLPSAKSDLGLFRIRISNELKEKQYTDVAELLVVNHPQGTSVLLDKKGTPRLITDPQPALSVMSSGGINLKEIMMKRDTNVFMFDNYEDQSNSLILKFRNENNSTSGKLLLKCKNTLWFDYLYGEFISKFGTSYDNWTEKQSKLPTKDRIETILKSEIPLCIYIKSGNEWKLVDYLMTVGPLASRDFVIPIDLTESDNEIIEIKLETGFMFWETDYAAMDFSKDDNMIVTRHKPESAKGTGDHDWRMALSATDGIYMEQRTPGLRTDIIFNTSGNSNQTSNVSSNSMLTGEESVFLHTRGYYELIRDFAGAPQLTELYKFKSPGYFSEFSKQQFNEWLTGENIIAVNN